MPAVCIVIYGASLLLAAIEAGLKERPELSIVHIDPRLPLADAQLLALHPHLVIVDGRHECAVVCPKTVLRVDRNANNQAAILNDQRFPIGRLDELVAVILHHVT
jgi:hypothetical protein